MSRIWIGRGIWAFWFALGIGWELFAVVTEKRTSQEPLTRIVRDRMMKSRYGFVAYATRFAVLGFLGYLAFHWLGSVPW